jgi:hypothetical protein
MHEAEMAYLGITRCIGAPNSLVRASIPTRRYVNHIALATFICESSSCVDEVGCDALM